MTGVVLFDGVCNLCNGTVDFLLRHDRRGRFRFAALQSPPGRALLEPHGSRGDALDSIVLLEAGRVFRQSDAVLRIVRGLGWPWSMLYAAIIVPRFVRDPVYAWIARHRYRWFGQRATCRIPTPEEQARFLA